MDEENIGTNNDTRTPRERVLEAALILFVDQGYFKTNLPDISRLSNCSVGSIYHHFLNKEEIARELYAQGMREFRQALAEALSEEVGLHENIHSMVKRFCDFSESHQRLSRYIWLARHAEFMSQKISQPTTVGFDSLGRKLTKMIKRGIRNEQIGKQNAEIVWTILFGIPLSFIRDWLDGYTKNNPVEMAEVLAESCWKALAR